MNLDELRQQQRAEQILYSQEEIADYRAQALNALVELDLDPDDAGRICDDALERENLPGYQPDSAERSQRAQAALNTVLALHARHYEDGPLTVSAAQLDIDPDIQIRVYGLDQDRVEQYRRAMHAGDEFPPVVAFWDGDVLRLADGFHRVAALPTTRVTIRAEIRTGGYEAAAEYAATCNAYHGLSLSRADKREAVRRLLHLHPEESSRSIARSVGVSHPFVEKIRRRIGANPDERVVQRGDQTYTVSVQSEEVKSEESAEPEHPDYVQIWEIESGIRDFLSDTLTKDTSPSAHIVRLMQIRDSRDYDQLFNHLPGPRRKRDIEQAVNNLINQYRQEEDQAMENKVNRTRQDEEWSAYKNQEEDVPEPEEKRELDRERKQIQHALVNADWHELRVLLSTVETSPTIYNTITNYPHALARAISLIFNQDNNFVPYDERANAVYCLYRAIVGPAEEIEQDESQKKPLTQEIACPTCGGDIVHISSNGQAQDVCEECGTVLEPEATSIGRN
jgi:hypothetical protein